MEQSRIELEYEKLDSKLILVEGDSCDKSDYLIAAFCGLVAGVVDALFVGKPNLGQNSSNSIIGNSTDKVLEG